MTDHVLALDLGLAKAGAATLTADGRIDTWLKTTPALGPTATLHAVADRIGVMAGWAVGLATTGTILAVVEGPAHAAQHGQPHERAGVWWAVVRRLLHHEIPVAVLAPKTVKGYIAGKGNASKDDVRRAVAAAWPGQGLGRISADEADAVAMCTCAADWLGWDGPWLDGRRGVDWLRKAAWPDRASVRA
ncbi:hypothetical protein [Pseudonocardia sp. D17]|uniref:hypothetical protein n=1 Tax=Pseudonocardia sp. D17 TaxID=882661 RepID=UPI002B3D9DB4|nr:hypothetical protein PSD17_55190 [Pseudonocardia sp. D17]